MPRIQASTVVEHRAIQRAALLEVARTLLAENPEETPTLAAVAARAGMGRSSMYAYFASREDLLGALIIDTFPRWLKYVQAQMAKVRTPAQQILAYVDANLHLVARGDHALASALPTSGLTDMLAKSSRLLHEELQAPLREALAAHGVSDPEGIGGLVQSVVYSLSRQIQEGLSESKAKDLAHEMLALRVAEDPAE